MHQGEGRQLTHLHFPRLRFPPPQINDNIFAYHFYLGKGEAEEAERARLAVVGGWVMLSAWIQQAGLSVQLTCLGQVLREQWGLV